MKILGIDPGVATTGWGVVDKQGRENITPLDVGIITTSATQKLPQRLHIIYKNIQNYIKRYKPQACAIEEVFFSSNAKTALMVGHARGVVMLCVAENNIPIYSYTPLQIKMALTGYGRADKRQMQEMVKRLLHLKDIPRPDDAADALAVALTHGFHSKINK